MPESVFNKAADLLAGNFKLKTASRIFFNEFCKNFKNNFLQDTSGRPLLVFKKFDIQSFNFKQICSLDQYCRHAIFDEYKHRFQNFHVTTELLSEQFLT